MPRARDPNRDHALEIWREQGGEITNRQIAEQLDIDEKKELSGSRMINGAKITPELMPIIPRLCALSSPFHRFKKRTSSIYIP